jgi:hypothetical protein
MNSDQIFSQYPKDERITIGDCECLVKKFKNKCVYLVTSKYGQNAENMLLVRMQVEAGILQLPLIDDHKDLRKYFKSFPKRGILYCMRGNKLVDYTVGELRRDWNHFFSQNSLHRVLRNRYENSMQALTEFHTDGKIIEQMALKWYGKVGMYTQDCVRMSILGAAASFYAPKIFNRIPPLYLN